MLNATKEKKEEPREKEETEENPQEETMGEISLHALEGHEKESIIKV